MRGEEGRSWNPMPALAYSYRKIIQVPPGFMFPSNGQIATNTTFDFTSYGLWRDLGINLRIFGTETRDWGSTPPSLKIPLSGFESETDVCEAMTMHPCGGIHVKP